MSTVRPDALDECTSTRDRCTEALASVGLVSSQEPKERDGSESDEATTLQLKVEIQHEMELLIHRIENYTHASAITAGVTIVLMFLGAIAFLHT